MMKYVYYAIAFSLMLSAAPAKAQRAVFIVRHAEKASETGDRDLPTQGKERAQVLAALLKSANIKAVYVSNTKRTQETAAPIAAQHIPQTIVEGGNPDKTFDDIKANHPEDVVLIVGHSNTVDLLVKKWAPSADVSVGGNEFNKMFVVIPDGTGPAGWTQFQYGAPNP